MTANAVTGFQLRVLTQLLEQLIITWQQTINDSKHLNT